MPRAKGESMRRKRQALCTTVLAITVVLWCSACTKNYQVHPGSASTFDSQSYDALLVADSSIKEAKADITAGTLPASSIGPANEVIKAYNVARASYITYHNAALAGSDTAKLQAQLTTDLQGVTQAIVAFKTAKGVKP